jgi:two-component system sensor histidine kinase DesK
MIQGHSPPLRRPPLAATPAARSASPFESPWLTLVYLIFVFVPLLFMPRVEWPSVVASVLATLLFVPIYVRALSGSRRQPLVPIAAVTGIGLALIPFNPGGNTFIIYTLAMAGAMLPPRTALQVSGAAWMLLMLVFWLSRYDAVTIAAYCGMGLVVGGMVLLGTVYGRIQQRQTAELQLSQDEVKRLATLAERERIARDLHDLLGHTLSVVVLKSELAGKLLERDPKAAREQIREVETVARSALAEVRQAVSGIRHSGLLAELAACRLSLLSAGVRLDQQLQPLSLLPPVEAALALCLREAITNVLRHAHAQQVEVTLMADGEDLVLAVRDDGRGGINAEGNGLLGMRERAAAIGGRVEIISTAGEGSTLSIRIQAPWLETAPLPEGRA